MPYVLVIMEPRDAETKHRIGREIADAVAEGTGNSIDAVQVIFQDVPRSGYVLGIRHASRIARSTAPPLRSEYIAAVRIRIVNESAYMEWRRDVANPALSDQAGFVSVELLRLPTKGEFFLLEKWMSAADRVAWMTTTAHREIERERERSGLVCEVVEDNQTSIVHQQFGRMGGVVLDSPQASAVPPK